MRIDCNNCQHQMELPDEKLPNQAFSIACPSCQNRIVVDPTAPAEGAAAAPAEGADAGAGAQAAASAGGRLTRLTPLRSGDHELMSSLVPSAFVVNIGLPADPGVTRELQRLGMEEVRDFEDLEEACEQLLENEAAIFLVRVPKASAPPFDVLTPIYKLPFDMRRRTFVALMADNVKSLDGQVAFYLQVNCLLSARELDVMAVKLRRALLYHLRLYRHWDVDVV